MDLQDFFNHISELKPEYNIKEIHHRSGETVAKRLAILTHDAYLEWGGDLHWACVIERRIFEDAKRENLTCDPIDHETHWQEIKTKCKDKEWNPLKLTYDRLDRYDGYHPVVVYISNQVMDIFLRKEQSDDETRGNEVFRSDRSETLTADPEGKSCNCVVLDERKGPSLRSPRQG